MAMYIYLERLQDEEAGEEGDDEGREPMADLVIAEGDPVGPDQEHGEEDGGEAEQPGQGQTQGRQLEPLLLLLWRRQLFFWPRRLLSDVITKRRGWPHGRRGGGGLEGPGNAVAAQGEGAGILEEGDYEEDEREGEESGAAAHNELLLGEADGAEAQEGGVQGDGVGCGGDGGGGLQAAIPHGIGQHAEEQRGKAGGNPLAPEH